MIAVELFYHCDHYECSHHAYVEGETVAWGEETHRLPKQLPEGWRVTNGGKTYCPLHGPAEAA